MQRLVIVTGASRGIGYGIVNQAIKKFNKNTLFILIARDENKLNEVKVTLEENTPENKFVSISQDFAKRISVEDQIHIISKSLDGISLNDITELYVFYNHGTIIIANLEDVADNVLDEFQINVASIWVLLASLRKMFPIDSVPKQLHVNISSIWAKEQQETVSIYNTTRIARETLFRCLALEQPKIRNFNYWPGPIYTDMLQQAYDSPIFVSDTFRAAYNDRKFLTAEQTAIRLFEAIDKDEYKNGEVVDYFAQI